MNRAFLVANVLIAAALLAVGGLAAEPRADDGAMVTV